jgi:hypothetical protein
LARVGDHQLIASPGSAERPLEELRVAAAGQEPNQGSLAQIPSGLDHPFEANSGIVSRPGEVLLGPPIAVATLGGEQDQGHEAAGNTYSAPVMTGNGPRRKGM